MVDSSAKHCLERVKRSKISKPAHVCPGGVVVDSSTMFYLEIVERSKIGKPTLSNARVAKLVDARDLKSLGT